MATDSRAQAVAAVAAAAAAAVAAVVERGRPRRTT
jgi:hypothetical protein